MPQTRIENSVNHHDQPLRGRVRKEPAGGYDANIAVRMTVEDKRNFDALLGYTTCENRSQFLRQLCDHLRSEIHGPFDIRKLRLLP